MRWLAPGSFVVSSFTRNAAVAELGWREFAHHLLYQLPDLPETALRAVDVDVAGAKFARGDDFAVVESVKAASDVYAPVSGSVVEVNGALSEAPEKVNDAAEGEAWFVRVKLSDAGELSGLMDEAAYTAYCEGL